MYNFPTVYFIGDIHGNIINTTRHTRTLKRDVIERFDLRDCLIICVGDLGLGFGGSIEELHELNEFLKGVNVTLWSIRGNHDDPALFNGVQRYQLSNFEAIEDYTVREINEELFLFVGGGISIDRTGRHRNQGSTYWEDERFVFDYKKIVHCDVLVTHSGPTWIGPYDKSGLQDWARNDPSLLSDCAQERINHNSLVNISTPKKHYCGHFHMYQVIEHNNCTHHILEELQIYEHRSSKSPI